MPPTYLLARDHLEQAVSILHGADTRTQQLRYIVQRTIALISEFEHAPPPPRHPDNVLNFDSYRARNPSV